MHIWCLTTTRLSSFRYSLKLFALQSLWNSKLQQVFPVFVLKQLTAADAGNVVISIGSCKTGRSTFTPGRFMFFFSPRAMSFNTWEKSLDCNVDSLVHQNWAFETSKIINENDKHNIRIKTWVNADSMQWATNKRTTRWPIWSWPPWSHDHLHSSWPSKKESRRRPKWRCLNPLKPCARKSKVTLKPAKELKKCTTSHNSSSL